MGIGRPVSLTSSIASKIVTATATAGQTSFTVTGGYNINQLAVFRNGVRLLSGSDYTAIDGGTVTLLSAANLNDTLEFQIFDTFQASDAILKSSSSQTIDGSLTATGGLNIGIQSAGSNVTTGVVTAFNFVGSGNTFLYDASSKTVDISISGGGGFATALSSTQGDFLNQVFVTPKVLSLGAGTSVSITSSSVDGNVAFAKADRVDVGTGSTLHVSAGTTFITNVLGVF